MVAALTWLAVGCANAPQQEPELVAACQAEELQSCEAWCYAGETRALRLLGQDLLARWEVDLGDDSPPRSLGAFRAWIGPLELEQPRLDPAPDPISGRQVVWAQLPAGLDVGFHPLALQTPAGQRAAAAGPFEIRSPLRLGQASLDKPSLPRGDTARLSLRLENHASAALGRVALELRQGGGGSFLLPQPPAPFSLAADSGLDVVLELRAGSPGAPQIEVSATALAADRVPVEAVGTVRLTAAVLPEAELELDAQLVPDSLGLGEPVELRVVATNAGGVAALAVRLLPPEVTGAGQVAWEADPIQPRDIAPGSSTTFRWSGTTSAPGSAWIQPILSGTEALSNRPLQATSAHPLALEIL